ncbi:MAG: ABC-F family ATP-binding cassette domain-containing protein [Polyangiaceae bacterium]|nr:ABC-F family ATP-binding cassette domain-containing protein [Polyangiaceae bacterium]
MNLGKSFGARTLFEGVNLQLTAGNRYGLVGANGSGKTTLLKIFSGDEPATEGSIGMQKGARLGVLRQDRFLDDAATIVDLAMQGDDVVYKALRDHERFSNEGKADAAAALEDVLRMHDGWALEARAGQVLEGLGVPTKVHKRPLSTLSGGFKLRVLLAQVLLGRPDVLLLDEPTNHLDIVSIRWLEKFLVAYPGCAVVVSHDQRFLDNVVTHVLDVDYETVTLYHGGYTAFEAEKIASLERKEAEIERAEGIVAQKMAFVERFRAKATKARQAQSRLKQIEKIEIEEVKPTSRRAPRIKLLQTRPSGRDVLKAEGIAKAYGEKKVLSDVDLSVRRGERLAVIGANGLGKSTLVRILAGRLDADAGESEWGHEVKVGYFPQDHKELFPDPKKKVLDYLWDLCPLEPTTAVRGQLGLVLFSGGDVEKKVESLSGGEAARLLFARLAVEKPNVLLLDEPTNHLDMEAVQALASAIKTYEGTTIFVSHNRWFVSELATRILEVKPDGVVDFPGGYEDYLARCGDDHLDAGVALRQAKAGAAPAAEAAPPDWEDQKKRRNRAKALRDKSEKLQASIAKKEERQKAISAKWYEDGFFEKTPADEVKKLQEEELTLGKELEAMMAEWEEIETELSTIGE